ncbi:hypothetical protein MMC30_005580 [Trapelia coarctata]|nr:hypothetical protein [Trapelia coarctata]
MSHLQLEHLLVGVDAELDAYDVDELRDGFFDASFYRPVKRDPVIMARRASETLPLSLMPHEKLPFLRSSQEQALLLIQTAKGIVTSRSGIKLCKSFLGFFISYVLCLIPVTKAWLGKYSYIMVVSAIINHPGRSIGSQIDGAVMTTLGTLAGLLWGTLATHVATWSSTGDAGYGGLLALFFIFFSAVLGWLRCFFLRLYQAILTAGIAICYACLAGTFDGTGWIRFAQYIIPWVLGQAVALLVSLLVFPAAGTRSIALSFHISLQTIEAALVLPHVVSSSLNRDLGTRFVDLSEAARDFTMDLTFSPFRPRDVTTLRNLVQGVVRAVLSIKPDTSLFKIAEKEPNNPTSQAGRIQFRPVFNDASAVNQPLLDPSKLVAETLATPIREMINALQDGIRCVDAVIMDTSGQRKYLGPPSKLSSDLTEICDLLRTTVSKFDLTEEALINNSELPQAYKDHPDLVELFLFVNPIRQTADRVLALLEKVQDMQQQRHKWRVNLPSYPFHKAILRSNAQARHDRGGLTAGFYFRSKDQLDNAMKDLQSRPFIPLQRHPTDNQLQSALQAEATPVGKHDDEKPDPPDQDRSPSQVQTLRYKLWLIQHRLEGFESRFMLKITLLTTLVSIPAWLPQSKDWWNQNQCWWTVAAIWFMMHPRVGGNLHDLSVRVFVAAISSLWGALAYAAGRGNPYVIATFAAIFMIPMIYRFTQSSHPRSGIIGCIAFTVVSLSEYDNAGRPSVAYIGWTRGITFVIGVVSAVVVNWILWPFVARDELRTSIANMLLHSAIIYRRIVAKYIYHNQGHDPTPDDIVQSERLEGRMREGFVRIRQLMELTRHEICLRAPFDPLPYSALIEACEKFFERLVDVRQSSVYFQPYMLYGPAENTTSLLAARRDAVAAILMNLYVLAGALQANHAVPRYLPSAAIARRRLLDIMEVAEAAKANEPKETSPKKGRKWADVYHYAYSAALTDIVEQLQQLKYYTKEIVGEVGFDLGSRSL